MRALVQRVTRGEVRVAGESVAEIGAGMVVLLVVSQITLMADCTRGRRPSLDGAAPAALAQALYEDFVRALRARGVPTRTGRFGALMEVELVNQGPVTLLLDEIA